MFTGTDTYEEVDNAKEQFFRALANLEITSGKDVKQSEVVDEFQTQNVVCTAELDENLNLNALAIGLGLETPSMSRSSSPA